MILNWLVLPMMFLILPAFWVGALTWIGIHAGSTAQALVTGTSDVKAAGAAAATRVIR
jgi:hypothetical protein